MIVNNRTRVIKVNLKNVSRWELGSSAPSFEAAAELAKILNVSLDYLGGLDNDNEKNELMALFTTKASVLTNEQKKCELQLFVNRDVILC